MKYEASEKTLAQTTKCPCDFGCLETGECHGRPICEAEPAAERRARVLNRWMAGVLFTAASIGGFFVSGPLSAGEIVAADYPPLSIKESELPGLSIEILKEAERRIGRDSPVSIVPFQRSLKTMGRRNDVIHVGLYRTPEREDKYTWVAKYYTFNDVFLTVGAPVNSFEEAKTLGKIGVEAGNAQETLLKRNGFTNLERADRAESNARKLEAGRIDAWALTDMLALWVWKRLDTDKRLVMGRPFRKSDMYFVAGLDFPAEEAELYRNAVQQMTEDGTIEKIIEKYR